jgi:hypothetical protein
MTGVRELRTHARRRLLVFVGIAAIIAGCSSPGDSQAAPSSIATGAPSGGAPTITPSGAATPGPTEAPASPGTITTDGFHFDDILKIQVNRLAVRSAPTKAARLLHQYLILGTTVSDLGEVRLNKGNFVKVQLGPLQVGDITWYLVWPAANAKLDDQTTNWYDKAPMAGQPVPGWIATAVGSAKYVSLERRPTAAQIEAVEAPGLVVAGTGNYVSPPMPRHDAFQFYWAISPHQPGAECQFKVSLVPNDADFSNLDIAGTSTTSVKVSPLNGTAESWPEAGVSTWTTFTLEIASTCNWAIRLIRLEHD